MDFLFVFPKKNLKLATINIICLNYYLFKLKWKKKSWFLSLWSSHIFKQHFMLIFFFFLITEESDYVNENGEWSLTFQDSCASWKISPGSSSCEIHLPSSGEMRTRRLTGPTGAEMLDTTPVFSLSDVFYVTSFFYF